MAKKTVKKVTKKAAKKVGKKAAKKAAKKAVVHVAENKYAIFCVDPFPGGTGAGGFQFFDKPSEFWSVLFEIRDSFGCEEDSEEGNDDEKVVGPSLSDQIEQRLALSEEEGIKSINSGEIEELLDNICEVLFFGETVELATSDDDDFAKEIRTEFREGYEGEGEEGSEDEATSQITKEESKNFFSFVAGYYRE